MSKTDQEPDEGYVERDLTPDELQLAFHEVECQSYDERFGISYDEHTAAAAAREANRLLHGAVFDTVVDVGCGTGFLGLGLASAGQARDLHLVDLSPGMLSRARVNAEQLGVQATFIEATAAALPFDTNSVDAVVTRGVLHHLHDVPAALAEWRRIVKPGGVVIALSEPTPQADSIGGLVARAALGSLKAARVAARAVGRPLSAHPADEAQTNHFWDLVSMAANLHTFRAQDLHELGAAAGFTNVEVRGSGLVSISWAAAYYCMVGELPALAASERAKRNSGRIFEALRRLDDAVVERFLPAGGLMTVQAIFRG
ncbi:MAG: ubiquinone/menaquinone biosynthesis C-methylase UbiE [Glaciecola sp.]|jgi:ubiquinone/menaquinone biosynthesis C-methylase UbiE